MSFIIIFLDIEKAFERSKIQEAVTSLPLTNKIYIHVIMNQTVQRLLFSIDKKERDEEGMERNDD